MSTITSYLTCCNVFQLSRSPDNSNIWNTTMAASNGDDSSSAGGKTDIFSESSSTSPPNTPGPSAAVPSFYDTADWQSFISPSQKWLSDPSAPESQQPPIAQQRRTSVEHI